MHPAFSVIFLTTLIGVGQGLFLALYTGQVYSFFKVLPVQDSPIFYGYGSLLALVFLILGLIASVFHLGRPERAWRAATKWRSSWLSREVIILPAFMLMTFLYAMVHITHYNPILLTLSDNIIVDLSLLIGAINTLLAFALFICTAMIYASVKFLQEWASPLTIVNYILLGGASGFALSTAFASYIKSDIIHFYAGWAIFLTGLALITRLASLIRNNKIKYKSNLSTAIGIRHTTIVQKAQGAMGGSFNTREYFHGVSHKVFIRIKWFFLIFAFAIPIILLSLGLSQNSLFFFSCAFILQYIGLIAERWFFFAQAKHPQNLYYQTI